MEDSQPSEQASSPGMGENAEAPATGAEGSQQPKAGQQPGANAKEDVTAAAHSPSFSGSGRQLRRQLDAEIEEELEAALSEFDGKSLLDAGPSRPTPPVAPPAADRGSRRQGRNAPPQAARQSVRVLAIRGEDVFVELGEKSEGIIPALQFAGKLPEPGDSIEVVVDRVDPATEMILCRLPGAVQEADWGSVQRGMIVDAHVKKANKGGLEVTVNGIRGFLPAGQLDLVYVGDLNPYVGQTLRCEITMVSLTERNLIVSRRNVLERERRERAEATLASLAEGKVYDGVVKSIKEFGAFVDIGGVDGLIHISQLSWQRVKDPNEILSLGQHVKVVVLKYDPETKKLGLGLRQLTESPWDKAAEKYHVGSIVSGQVSKIMDFGAFVELEPGVEGLIHVSELARGRVHRVRDVVKDGQSVDVKVIGFDAEQKRISLSLKQAIPEPEPEPVAAAAAVEEEEEPAPPPPKRPQKELKGGLGGPSGPLFG